ncbi:hypothetical protein EXIGLDRAFT_726199 [Exidia glandulosa HHB12029]|uniref:Uncharacterized protein n=1 Tax=Exidia glandulosa HHB12029 TaxID=1314781 RepID=A0A165MDK8_EXIGL|nr:hypothetical protein EXIGLDRAFT_726199 [Exidia glandulosa HHB12029]
MAINLSFVRDKIASDREQYTARATIIQSLINRIRASEIVPDAEIERNRRLAWGLNADGTLVDRPVSWREVFFGRKT